MDQPNEREKQERHLLEILRDIKNLGYAPTIGNVGAVFVVSQRLAIQYVANAPITGQTRTWLKITARGLSLLEHLEREYGDAHARDKTGRLQAEGESHEDGSAAEEPR